MDKSKQNQYAFILGSNPLLSAAEIRAFFSRIGGSIKYDLRFFPIALVVITPDELDTKQIITFLGGTPIIVRIHHAIPSNTSPHLLFQSISEILISSPQTKQTIGISWLPVDKGIITTTKDIQNMGIDFKRFLRKEHSLSGLRVVLPQKGTTLSTAQLFHANIPEKNTGVALIHTSNEICIGTVQAVQDIQQYTTRDRGRPAVDPGSGMMPVKLAQIMVNLSLAPLDSTIFDPLCGTGTIPMEALLMGHPIFASDRSPKQVSRTTENISWLKKNFSPPSGSWQNHTTFVHNITTPFPSTMDGIHAVVTEGWLGPACAQTPTYKQIHDTFRRIETILRSMLLNLPNILEKNASMVICIPAFRIDNDVVHAPFLSQYPRHAPFLPSGWRPSPLLLDAWKSSIAPYLKKHALSHHGTLVYGRSDAIVLREILRITRY